MRFNNAAFSFASLHFILATSKVSAVTVHPRHCHGHIKHVHLAVGRDPSTQMTVSFATMWSQPGVNAPVAGCHIGTSIDKMDRFVAEQEFPISYDSSQPYESLDHYYSPYQHHITFDDLEPDTTYYYVCVSGSREEGIEALETKDLRDHPSQHTENSIAENFIIDEEELEDKSDTFVRGRLSDLGDAILGEGFVDEGDDDPFHRRLAPPPYDGSKKPCMEHHKIRSFKTAPEPGTGPVGFAIIGDLGQFDHSCETLGHLRDHLDGIHAVMLNGDIAYTDDDHRRWDTFFDFIDDHEVFGLVPLQVATGNHDIEKQANDNKIFQAYETRFRMPRIKPAQLGVYDGPVGKLNMDSPPYPLPYEYGNAYYAFTYGISHHIVVSAYSSMEPGSQQYNWLLDEFESVDRTVTPWLLVHIHVPIYNTFALHKHDKQIVAAKEHLEPLLVQYNVNLVFTGHIHAYERTANVNAEKLDPKGPIHITVGAGGRKCDAPFKTEEPEEWALVRDATFYGYGTLKIHNNTHAQWDWIPLSRSDITEYNLVSHHDEIQLEPVFADSFLVENQIHL